MSTKVMTSLSREVLALKVERVTRAGCEFETITRPRRSWHRSDGRHGNGITGSYPTSWLPDRSSR